MCVGWKMFTCRWSSCTMCLVILVIYYEWFLWEEKRLVWLSTKHSNRLITQKTLWIMWNFRNVKLRFFILIMIKLRSEKKIRKIFMSAIWTASDLRKIRIWLSIPPLKFYISVIWRRKVAMKIPSTKFSQIMGKFRPLNFYLFKNSRICVWSNSLLYMKHLMPCAICMIMKLMEKNCI